MSVVKMEKLFKYYHLGKLEVPALKDINLSFAEGDFASIAGPSGSGKTTLLNLIGCLDKPSKGKISIGNEDVSHFNSNQLADIRNYNIGFIFQTFNLIPVLTAYENVEFPLIIQGEVDKKVMREKVMNILKEMDIVDLWDRKPNEISGGQQQRVAIARALIKRPKVILADEPTANLDSHIGEEILKLMYKMNQKHKVTFIFSTHDPMVMHYAARLVKLHDGEVVSDEKKH
ncbi:ABC transporter ATP-binding protein [bacterium]|nr:ABC transporter ATP-binding protein [bacterium]MBT7087559.1 ABC transporter ATP-binding protein [bacterium]